MSKPEHPGDELISDEEWDLIIKSTIEQVGQEYWDYIGEKIKKSFEKSKELSRNN